MTQLEIRTERLLLREVRTEDANWIPSGISNPNVQKWLTGPPHPFLREHCVAWIKTQSPENGTFVIESDRPIGVVGIERGINGIDLGYWISESAWGNGYMTEAVDAGLNWHFETRGGDLRSGYMPRNHKSRRVLENLGFKRTELSQEFSPFFGKDVDIQRVALTSQDWRLRHA